MSTPAQPGAGGRSRSPAVRRAAAFTLLEVLLVLLLLGLLASLAVVQLTGVQRRRHRADTLEELAWFDHLARADAQASGRPLLLVVDLERQELRRLDEKTQDARGAALLLSARHPEAGRLAEVLWMPGDGRRFRRVTGGQVSLPCSAQGATPAYALVLTAPGGARPGVFFAGLTGQSRRLAGPEELRPLEEVLAHETP